MAASIQKQLGEPASLVPGNAGEFTVWLDGAELVRKTTQVFPEPAEVIAKIRAARGAP